VRLSSAAVAFARHEGELLLLFVTLLAAGGWVFSYEALKWLPPLGFMALRFLLASAVMLFWGGPALGRMVQAGQLAPALRIGVVFGLAMVCWVQGLAHAQNLGIGAFLCSLGVVFAPLTGRWLLGLRLASQTLWAMLLACLGMLCLMLHQGGAVARSDLLFLAAAALGSLQFNLNSRDASRLEPLPLTAVQLAVAGLVCGGLSLWSERWPVAMPLAAWGWLGASALLATGLRFYLQVRGQGRTSLSHAAFIMTLEPVWATLLAMLWRGERLDGWQWGGCALILLALLVGRWPALRQRL
jgi:drug/metabolite transporter (DMT)-like permease